MKNTKKKAAFLLAVIMLLGSLFVPTFAASSIKLNPTISAGIGRYYNDIYLGYNYYEYTADYYEEGSEENAEPNGGWTLSADFDNTFTKFGASKSYFQIVDSEGKVVHKFKLKNDDVDFYNEKIDTGFDGYKIVSDRVSISILFDLPEETFNTEGEYFLVIPADAFRTAKNTPNAKAKLAVGGVTDYYALMKQMEELDKPLLQRIIEYFESLLGKIIALFKGDSAAA